MGTTIQVLAGDHVVARGKELEGYVGGGGAGGEREPVPGSLECGEVALECVPGGVPGAGAGA